MINTIINWFELVEFDPVAWAEYVTRRRQVPIFERNSQTHISVRMAKDRSNLGKCVI